MNTLLEFLKKNAFTLMMAGFFLVVVGLLVFMRTRYRGDIVSSLSFAAAIAGVVIYLIGRIFMAFQRKDRKSTQRNS